MSFVSDFIAKYAPVSYWAGEETSGTVAVDAVGAHNGTYDASGVTLGAPPLFVSAAASVDYSGGRAYIPYGAWMEPAQFSVVAWFKTDSIGSLRTVVSRYDNGLGVGWSLRGDNATLTWYNFKSAYNSYAITNALAANTVYRVVVTYDGTQYQFWIQNTKIGPWVTAGPGAGTSGLSIGSGANNSEDFDGKAGHVAFFNRVLTDAEVNDMWAEANELSTPPVAAPSNVTATGLDSAVLVKWSADQTASQGYDLTTDGGATTVRVASTATSTTLTGLTNGTTYPVQIRSVNTHGPGPWSAAVNGTPQPTLLYDDFERADSSTSPGAPVQGGPYTVESGGLGITGGTYLYGTSNEAVLTAPGAADVDVQMTVSGVNPNDLGIVFRFTDASNYWLLDLVNGRISAYRKIAGTFAELSTGYWPTTPGDTFRVVARARNLLFYRNGVLIMETADPWFNASASNKVGVRFGSNNGAGGNRVDKLLARPVDAAEFSKAGALPSDVRVPATLPSMFVYKGRNAKTADSGSVA